MKKTAGKYPIKLLLQQKATKGFFVLTSSSRHPTEPNVVSHIIRFHQKFLLSFNVSQCLRNRARTPVLPLERAPVADRPARLPERMVRLVRLLLQGQDPLLLRQLREAALGKRGRRILVHGLRGQVQAPGSRIGQARHLPLARQDLQRGVYLVGGVDIPVSVGIVRPEGVEARGGTGPVRQGYSVAEQLASVVRLTVEVLVQHQERVRLVDPPRELVKAVGVQVEIRCIFQFHLAVAVQVQDQRVNTGWGGASLTPWDWAWIT